MQHHFDVEIAQKVGILPAVLFNHFVFWNRKNEAEKRNLHDGEYWTFYSVSALKELFPYASEKQIRNALQRLIDNELIKTGNYNEDATNRTKWYTLGKKGKCICPKGQMQFTERANASAQKGKCLNSTDNNNTDNDNTDNKRYSESDALNDAIIEWLNYKKEKRQTYQKTGLAQLIKKINRLVSDHGEAAIIDAIHDSMANGWAGIYVKNQPKKIDESKTDLDDIF